MRVLAYVRVSTTEQAQDGYSIGEQIDRITKYAAAMDWTIVRVFTDPGFSGASMDRPGLRELIRVVKSGQADKVLVYKLDRLSRSQKDTLYLIEDVFLKNGTDFVSMSENFDTATPFGRAMIGILAVFAQLERETIKERMMLGRVGRAKNGYYCGAHHSLIGYEYKNGELIPDPYEAMLVKTVFSLFTDGTPINKIRKELNQRGLIHDGHPWYNSTVRRLLDNRHYIGEVGYSDAWYPGRHEPIIDLKTFERAQKLLKRRAESYSSTNNHVSYLTGFIYCGQCGAKYGRKQYSRTRTDGTYRSVYLCYSREKRLKKMIKDPNCKNKIYETSELEAIVFGEIRKLAVDPEYLERMYEAPAGEVDEAGAIEAEIRSLTGQISRYMDLYALDRLTLEEADAKIGPLTDRRDLLEEELKREKRSKDMSREEVSNLVTSFGDVLDRGDLNEVRLVLTSLIDKIIINGEDVTIYWTFN